MRQQKPCVLPTQKLPVVPREEVRLDWRDAHRQQVLSRNI
jgi:hypothetical protein